MVFELKFEIFEFNFGIYIYKINWVKKIIHINNEMAQYK